MKKIKNRFSILSLIFLLMLSSFTVYADQPTESADGSASESADGSTSASGSSGDVLTFETKAVSRDSTWAGDAGLTNTEEGDAADALQNLLINNFLTLVRFGGAIILFLGLGQMALAFKDDNADSKLKGTMLVMGGVFCISIKTILQTFL